MPCTSCFYGKWAEDVCAGQFGIFVYLVLHYLLGLKFSLTVVIPIKEDTLKTEPRIKEKIILARFFAKYTCGNGQSQKTHISK